MSILSPTTLETANYDAPLWVHIYNANVKKLHDTLCKVQGLQDVNADSLKDGSVLFWFSSHSLWKTRLVKL